MAETQVEKQLRIVLEEQCVQLFHATAGLRGALGANGDPISFGRCYRTLILFDYGDPETGYTGNIAFKTSLPSRGMLISTVQALLLRWQTGERTRLNRGDALRHKVLDADSLCSVVPKLRPFVPAGVGFALLVGEGPFVQYVSTGDRGGMKSALTGLLEHWRDNKTEAF